MLVDAPEPGSGKVFDWSLLDGTERGLPLILAGGLNPDNVGRAVRAVRPWGVDVATGVESSPGRKDPTMVREFVHNARAAGEEIEPPEVTFEPDTLRPYDWRDE